MCLCKSVSAEGPPNGTMLSHDVAKTMALISSVIVFISGIVLFFVVGLVYVRSIKPKQSDNKASSDTVSHPHTEYQSAPVYESVLLEVAENQEQYLELKENIAYCPVQSTNLSY